MSVLKLRPERLERWKGGCLYIHGQRRVFRLAEISPLIWVGYDELGVDFGSGCIQIRPLAEL